MESITRLEILKQARERRRPGVKITFDVPEVLDAMSNYSKIMAIDFVEWTTKYNWICRQHPTDANQKVWVKSYWSFYDINVWRTTEQLYDVYIDYEAMNAPTEPHVQPK